MQNVEFGEGEDHQGDLQKIDPTPYELLLGGESVRTLCDANQLIEKTYEVTFEADSETCLWGQDGNRPSSRGNIINAEESKYREIADSEWQIICGIQMETNESGFADDDLTITFNDYIVATSWTSIDHHIANGMASENGLVK